MRYPNIMNSHTSSTVPYTYDILILSIPNIAAYPAA